MSARIVHVVYRFAVGGLENGLVNLVNHLPADTWRHAIVSLTDIDPAFAARITAPDVELVALGKRPGHAFALYPAFGRLLRGLAPSIVHTRNLAALELQPVAWLASSAARVHGEHGRDARDPDLRDLRRRRIRKFYRPFVSRYVAVAPDLGDYLVNAVGVARERVAVITNGVDTARFRPAVSRQPIASAPHEAGEGLFVAGTVGRLDPMKDHVGLVRAVALLLDREPALRRTLRLVIAGEGTERPRIEAEIARHGLQEVVWMAGERADVASLLQGLDLFVLPSLAEGVSNTVLEAMASGLPVVATDVGANAMLVDAGTTGAIVPPGDGGALADAIARYVRDLSMARQQGAAGRRRAHHSFSLERMVEHYHQLYLDVLARRAAAPAMAQAPAGGPARQDS